MDYKQFESQLNKKKLPVVIDIWAPWCGPCRAMEPAFDEISKKYDQKVEVWKLNADQSPEVLRKLGVMSIPTVIGFADGQEIYRRTGMQTADMLEALFESTLNRERPAIIPPTPIARMLRTILGILIMLSGWMMDQTWWLIVVGGLVVFSAYYDRCPIMQMMIPRVKSFFKKENEQPTS